jgi:DNA polymerase III delta subunit
MKTAQKKLVEKKTKKVKKPSKKATQKKLKRQPEEKHYFVLISGHKIKNAKELADTLEHIDHEQFFHHVNEERNDFTNWLIDVFEEHELAEKVKTARDKEHARLIIYKHISDHFW